MSAGVSCVFFAKSEGNGNRDRKRERRDMKRKTTVHEGKDE